MENITSSRDAVVKAGAAPVSPVRFGRVSICVIARNEAAAIGGLIGSLASQTLFVTGREVDLLVVSNASTDGTAAIARAACASSLPPNVKARVHDTPEGGKARSWNLAVHELLDPDTEAVLFVDADIDIAGPDVLEALLARLEKDPALKAVSGFPVKDIARKPNKSLVDRFSLRISSQTPAPHAINGSLYAARMDEISRIWLPVPTPGEDGALTAMIHTDGFTRAARPGLIARMPEPTHFFEAHSVRGYFRHERRITLGTAINGWIFEHLWAGRHRVHVGSLIRHWNAHDPSWIDRIVANNVEGKRLALPSRMWVWRLHNLKGVGWRKALVRAPFSLAATLLNVWPCVEANRVVKRRGAAAHW